jgi:hypothetical protein
MLVAEAQRLAVLLPGVVQVPLVAFDDRAGDFLGAADAAFQQEGGEE